MAGLARQLACLYLTLVFIIRIWHRFNVSVHQKHVDLQEFVPKMKAHCIKQE